MSSCYLEFVDLLVSLEAPVTCATVQSLANLFRAAFDFEVKIEEETTAVSR